MGEDPPELRSDGAPVWSRGFFAALRMTEDDFQSGDATESTANQAAYCSTVKLALSVAAELPPSQTSKAPGSTTRLRSTL